MTDHTNLVPGRECGACNACCRDLAITEDGMNKAPGILCRHWTAGTGCTIYDSRPEVCRSYHCGWRSLADLGESWRPDRSGILINIKQTPGETFGDVAANLIVIGGAQVVRSNHFAGLAASFVDGGTATFFLLPGEAGFVGHFVFLNPLLADAVAAKSLEQVKEVIGECHEVLLTQPPVLATPEQMGVLPSRETMLQQWRHAAQTSTIRFRYKHQ